MAVAVNIRKEVKRKHGLDSLSEEDEGEDSSDDDEDNAKEDKKTDDNDDDFGVLNQRTDGICQVCNRSSIAECGFDVLTILVRSIIIV